jgi:hypothetical protein
MNLYLFNYYLFNIQNVQYLSKLFKLLLLYHLYRDMTYFKCKITENLLHGSNSSKVLLVC